ncbi:HK97 family phage prohead protease [Amycolatopsis kentuckyensis]|uniref:HK97 family phage prohead protease n=1 Tax=Amycolatopsis kentuckyensis TaxID=218823 RepID=UPI000A3ABFBB|nr:HK97 family phage prohead protease [Amycolatopsis kentuckyensis]
MALRSQQATEERRDLNIKAAGVEVRADGGEGDAPAGSTFVGHAAVFNTRTAIGNPLTWGFYEQIAEGAFTKTLSEGDARMLVDHDSCLVVARVSAGTLRLSQDATGLAVEADLDGELSYVRDLEANLRNGNITGMSFGFYVVKDDWSVEEVELSDGNSAEIEVRTILEVRLLEVSAVTFPAYEETDAGLRALAMRSNRAAIERRLPHLPQAAKLLADIPEPEPGETTRADEEVEPAASTRVPVESLKLRMKSLPERYHGLEG